MPDGFKIADAFVSVGVEDNTRAGVAAIADRLSRLDATAHVNVDVDNGGVIRAAAGIRGAANDIGSSLEGGGTRGALAMGALGAGALKSAGIFAALTSAVGAAGAGIGALPALGAAGASAGAVLVGAFSGVGDALKAYKADQDTASTAGARNAAQSAADARQIRDAQQSIADARRNQAQVAAASAQAIADAEESQRRTAQQGADAVAAAGRRVEDALGSEKSAQQNLTDARKEAAGQLRDLRDQVSDLALDEEGASIRVAEAEANYRKTMANSAATDLDRRKATYDLAVARDHLSDVQRNGREKTEELRQAEAKGVEGSAVVVDAQGRVRTAHEAVGVARQDLARTEANANQANQDASREVARVVAQAGEQQQAANRQVAAAVEHLRDTEAQQAEQAGVAATASNTYTAALAKLTPAGRGFVEQLVQMGPLVTGLRNASQESFLPGLTSLLRDTTGLFPIFQGNIRATGTLMGDIARQAGTLIRSDEFRANLTALFASTQPIIRATGEGLVHLTGGLVGFGARMAPISDGVARFITSTINGFTGMLNELAPHADSFRRIWEALGRVVEALLPALGRLAGFLADRLAPVLESVAGFLEHNGGAIDRWGLALLGLFAIVKGVGVIAEVNRWGTAVLTAIERIGLSSEANGARVGAFGGKLGALKALGAAGLIAGVAVAIDDVNVQAAGGSDDLGQWGGELHGLVGAGKLLLSLDFKTIISQWNEQGRQTAQVWRDGKAPVQEWYRVAADTLGRLPGDAAAWFGGLRDQVFDRMRAVRATIDDGSRDAWNAVAGWFSRLPGDTAGWFGDMTGRATGAIGQLRDGVSGAAASAWQGVAGWFGRLGGDASGWFDAARAAGVGRMVDLAAGVDAQAGRGWAALSGWFSRLGGDANGWFRAARDQAVGWTTDLAGVVGDRAQAAWNGISGWFSRLPADVGGWYSATRDAAAAAMTSLAAGVFDRARDTWNNVSGWFSHLPADVFGWFSDARNRAVALMVDLAAGIFDRARDGWNNINGWFSRLPADVFGWFSAVRNTAVDWLANLAGGAFDRGRDAWNGINTWFSRLPGDVGGWFSATRNTAVDWMSNLAVGVFNAAHDMWNGVSTWFSRLPADTFGWLRDTFNGVNGWLGSIAQAFTNTVDWVRVKWDEIRGDAERPVRYVIDTVYEHGIKPVWNGIASVFGMARLAAGGLVPGQDVGYDYVPALLRGGEGVLVPEAVRMIGGAAGIDRLNRSAETQHFADGGVAGFHGSGSARGYRDKATGSVQASTLLGSFMSDLYTDAAGAVRRMFAGALGDAGNTPGGGMWRDFAAKLPGMLVDKIIGKAQDFASSPASVGNSGGPAPSGQVSGWIAQALNILGFPQSYAAGLAQQIRTESGGNPRAVQHGYVDVNTLTGNLAQGIMQVIPPTFRANMMAGHGDPFNPVDNIIAGARYAMRRYGPSWFAPGPRHSHGYDMGGLATGVGLLPKYTPQPERVLSPEQTSMFERALNGGFGGAGGTHNWYVTIDAKSVAEMRSVSDFFDSIQQTARRGPTSIAGVRR